MKYWKGRTGTPKEGQFGTMDDTGTVPDADECTQAEYDAWMATFPAPQITAAYQQAIDDLNTIINTANPTNAQVVWAVKRLAEIEKLELQFHKVQYTLS